jgi:Fe-S-cluster-containing dehydrogenase component
MAKRLFIDMVKCDECAECTVRCAYMYQPTVTDHGLRALREEVAFLLTCRRCEEPSCVAACKFEALERREDGVMVRHNMRCVSCKCCSHACPFGTIYPELTPFYAVRCDYCLSQMQKGELACVSS